MSKFFHGAFSSSDTSSSSDSWDDEREVVKKPVTATKKPILKKPDTKTDAAEPEDLLFKSVKWASDGESTSSASLDNSGEEEELSSVSTVSSTELAGKKPEECRDYFLKKKAKDGDGKKSKPKTKAPSVGEGAAPMTAEGVPGSGSEEEEEEDTTPWQRQHKPLFDPQVEVTHAMVLEKLKQLDGKSAQSRDRLIALQDLQSITEARKMNIAVRIKVRLAVVVSMFDVFRSHKNRVDLGQWKRIKDALAELIALLCENVNVLTVTTMISPEEELLVKPGEDNPKAVPPPASTTQEPYLIYGSALNLVQWLDRGLYNLLLHSNSYEDDYEAKRAEEASLWQLLEKCRLYVDLAKSWTRQYEAISIYLAMMEYTHYKYTPDDAGAEQLMQDLAKSIFSLRPTKREAQHLLLYLVYHHALHDRYEKARALVLSSRIQASIPRSDNDTIAIYHRAICQVGICAFRFGRIKEAHETLAGLVNTRHGAMLLAQRTYTLGGMQLSEEEETKLSKIRQYPYHMRVDYEFAEHIFCLCSMLLEVALMAGVDPYDTQKQQVSRSFLMLLRGMERSCSGVYTQEMLAPRECIHAATHALFKTDWKRCNQFIGESESMEKKFWSKCSDAERLKPMVERMIKEEALRVYLHLYSPAYSRLSVQVLAELFEMNKSEVAAVTNKMIVDERLTCVYFDESRDYLLCERSLLGKKDEEIARLVVGVGRLLALAPSTDRKQSAS